MQQMLSGSFSTIRKMISSHVKWLKSAAIIFYISYIFVAGVPLSWLNTIISPVFDSQSLDPAVFPWIKYNAFVRLRLWHTELLFEGKTFDNALVDMGGSRGQWTSFVLVSSNELFAQTFCSQKLDTYNTAARSSLERLQELSIFEASWPIPPDTTLPPSRKNLIAKCTVSQYQNI